MSPVGLLAAVMATTAAWLFLPAAPPRGRTRRASTLRPVARFGDAVATRVAPWFPSIRALSPGSIGAGSGAALAAAVLSPLLGVGVMLSGGLLAFARSRRAARRLERARAASVVQLVDLLALGVAAGLPIRAAFAAARPHLSSVHGELVAGLLYRLDHGSGFADALAWYGRELGAHGHDLVAVLTAAERDGAPLAPGLERVAETVRRERRRDLEQRVRKLPVTMLLPLVVCVLPAFVVLTIVPVLVTTLADLELPG